MSRKVWVPKTKKVNYFETLPYEAFFKIALELPYDDITNNCRVSRRWNDLCKDSYFWQQKALIDLNISLEKFNKHIDNLTAKERYLQLYSRQNVSIGSERFKDRNHCLHDAVRKGDLALVKYFISMGANSIEKGLYTAAKYGNFELVDYFLSLGALSIEKALVKAYKNDQTDMYHYLFALRKPEYDKYTYTYLILAAAEKGDIDDAIVSWFKEYQKAPELSEEFALPDEGWLLSNLKENFNLPSEVYQQLGVTPEMGLFAFLDRIKQNDVNFIKTHVSQFVTSELPFNTITAVITAIKYKRYYISSLILNEFNRQGKTLSEANADRLMRELVKYDQKEVIKALQKIAEIKPIYYLDYFLENHLYDEFKDYLLENKDLFEELKKEDGIPILDEIISKGSLELLRFLLSNSNLSIYAIGYLYHLIIDNAYFDMFKILDKYVKFKCGSAPYLNSAIYSENLSMIKFLIDLGCPIEYDIGGIDRDLDPNFTQSVIDYLGNL